MFSPSVISSKNSHIPVLHTANDAAGEKKTSLRFNETPDTYEGESASKLENTEPCHFQDACRQYLNDNTRAKPGLFAYVLARVFGRTLLRQVSNILSYVRKTPFFDARRDYPVLPPETLLKNPLNQPLFIDGKAVTAEDLAHRYSPKFSTISEMQSQNKETQTKQVRYEVLPPKGDDHRYSIVYYIGRETETMPIPVIGTLYDWIRPILYGTKQDWEPIQIDVDQNTGEPLAMMYETSNYSNESTSFNLVGTKNLHLRAKVVKQKDGTWQHTTYQKNGSAKSSEIENPFKDNQLKMSYVAWNGSIDLEQMAKRRGYEFAPNQEQQKLYPLEDAPLSFLDIDTYANEGIDLRATWLEQRKQGRCIMQMPARKRHVTHTQVNLIGDRMPTLVRGLNNG